MLREQTPPRPLFIQGNRPGIRSRCNQPMGPTPRLNHSNPHRQREVPHDG